MYGGRSILEYDEQQKKLLPKYGHCCKKDLNIGVVFTFAHNERFQLSLVDYYLEGCYRDCDPVPIMLCDNMTLTHIPPIVYDNMTAINTVPQLGIYMENNRLILEEDTLQNVTLWYLYVSIII